mgnify:CR=1 FL=1
MKYYNTPECQFEGVVEDETAYKFGSYTKEESDERYASKETEEKAESAVQQIENKVDKADFDGFKRNKTLKNLQYVCFTVYDATIPNVSIAFKPQSLGNTLGEYISKKKIPYVFKYLDANFGEIEKMLGFKHFGM